MKPGTPFLRPYGAEWAGSETTLSMPLPGIYTCAPPALLQRIGLALGAPVGKLFGYGSTYEPVGDVAIEAA